MDHARDTRAPRLEVVDVHVRYGGVHALRGVTFSVEPGEVCGLVGPNGAGKTTLFNVISRLQGADAGQVTFGGRRVLDAPPYEIPRLGIARTFQHLGIYPQMSVLENVLLGGHARTSAGFVATGIRTRRARGEEAALVAQARRSLAELWLDDVEAKRASDLNYATLKRVEIARALMSNPSLLLIDEPAGGLSHAEIMEFVDGLRRLQADRELSILLVDHHMAMVTSISDKMVVLDFGEVIAIGTPQEVTNDPRVIEAYLGRTA